MYLDFMKNLYLDLGRWKNEKLIDFENVMRIRNLGFLQCMETLKVN